MYWPAMAAGPAAGCSGAGADCARALAGAVASASAATVMARARRALLDDIRMILSTVGRTQRATGASLDEIAAYIARAVVRPARRAGPRACPTR